MLEIHIRTIPHSRQRYDTIGDWIQEEDGSFYIRVSQLDDWRMEFAVAIHELVELALCKQAGITQQQVDEFDFASDREDPGMDIAAPYHREHLLACGIENSVLHLLGVSQIEYEERCRNPIPDSTSSANKAMVPDSQSG